MNKVTSVILISAIAAGVALGVYSNVKEQQAIDRSKLPPKVELSSGFQRWITNLKNNKFVIDADEFRLKEEDEIYNTKWMKIYSIDAPGMQEQFNAEIAAKNGIRHVVFSPSQREYLDFRHEARDGYAANELHFYGQKEDKIIDARILDCSVKANCIFDRGFFIDNDVFVVTELSRDIDKKDVTTPECLPSQKCTYTYKIHVIDLILNSRLVYESKPFDIVLDDVKDNL